MSRCRFSGTETNDSSSTSSSGGQLTINRRDFLVSTAASIWTVRAAAQDLQEPVPTRTREVESVDISPDGRLVAAGYKECRLCLWDRQTGRQLWFRDVDHSGMPSVRFSPNGRLVACSTVSFDDPSRYIVADAATGRMRTMPEGMTIHDAQLCWAANDDRLHAVGRYSDNLGDESRSVIKVCTVVPGSPEFTQEVICKGDFGHIHFARAARYAVLAHDGSLIQWSVSEKRELSRVRYQSTSNGYCSAVSADGSLYAEAGDVRERQLGVAEVFETSTGRRVTHVAAEGHWVRAVAFSPDSRCIATGAGNRSVRVWDIDTGRVIWAKQAHTNTVRAIRFSADGRLLVSGSGGPGNPDDGGKRPPEGEVIVWDAATGQSLNTFRDVAPDPQSPLANLHVTSNHRQERDRRSCRVGLRYGERMVQWYHPVR